MISGIIFLIHLIFLLTVFYKRYQNESLGNALIDSILIIILFSVGWSIFTIIAKLFWDQIGFGKHFDRDTIALTLTTTAEYLFYRIYFKDLFSTSDEKGK